MHGTIKSSDEARERAYSTPLDQFDVGSPELFRDYTFWPYFERLRKEEPIHYCARRHVRSVLVADQVQRHHGGRDQPRGVLVGGSARRHLHPRPAGGVPPHQLHRHGPAAPRPAAQDRGADVHADASGRAGDQHPQALGGGAGPSAAQRDVRLGRPGLDRADDADARRAVRLSVGGAAQADALVRRVDGDPRRRRRGRDRRGEAGGAARVRRIFRTHVGRAHQAAAEERPACR